MEESRRSPDESAGEAAAQRPGGSQDERPTVDLTADPITESISQVAPRGRPAGGVPFMGLLADDDEEGYIRVYQDYELKSYVRIPRDAVRHRERVRNAGGVEVSMVLVDGRAEVEMLEINAETFQADMLARALVAAEPGAARAGGPGGAGIATPTVTTITPPLTAAVCTKIFCTGLTCACTARHSTICSIACTDHPVCPNPWTENWFCAAQR